MNPLRHWILVASNLIIAIAICYYVFVRSSREAPPATASAAPAASVEINLDPLVAPIESLEKSLASYAETLQRFNTSLVQYDFLQKEIQRLANLDQLVANQLNIELQASEQLDEEAAAAADETIGQIREFQTQVQSDLEQRRQMIFQLIAGLEEQLSKSAGEENLGEVIGDTPPTTPPAPNPNLAPFTPPTGD